jgi:hypothetical protein
MYFDLKKLSSTELVSKTKELVAEERRVSTEILWHLREIESRRLFSEMGFGSMFEMMTQYYGYSEGSAYRRISAARVLRDVPEVDLALKEGRLSLTTVSLAHGFFQNEQRAGKPYSTSEKQEVLKILEGKSRLEAEKELATRAPIVVKSERVRAINGHQTELSVTVSDELMAKLEKLKMLLSHKNPAMTFSQLIEYLADSALSRLDPEVKATSPGEVKVSEKVGNPRSRYVPARLEAKIWRRAHGRCEYKDLNSGRRCRSRFMLELDHRVLFVHGGKTEEKNLRLLCRNHNVYEAYSALGADVMDRYLGKPG